MTYRGNLAYNCEKEGADSKIIRIVFPDDRQGEEILAEVEYVRNLSEHDGSVADVISSSDGNLLEEVTYEHQTYFVCLFEKARGRSS